MQCVWLKDCITPWLEKHGRTCPNCQRQRRTRATQPRVIARDSPAESLQSLINEEEEEEGSRPVSEGSEIVEDNLDQDTHRDDGTDAEGSDSSEDDMPLSMLAMGVQAAAPAEGNRGLSWMGEDDGDEQTTRGCWLEFQREMRPKVKEEDPSLSPLDVDMILEERWRELDKEGKEKSDAPGGNRRCIEHVRAGMAASTYHCGERRWFTGHVRYVDKPRNRLRPSSPPHTSPHLPSPPRSGSLFLPAAGYTSPPHWLQTTAGCSFRRRLSTCGVHT